MSLTLCTGKHEHSQKIDYYKVSISVLNTNYKKTPGLFNIYFVHVILQGQSHGVSEWVSE